MAEAFPRFEMPEGTETAVTSSEDPIYRPQHRPCALAIEVRFATTAEHPELVTVAEYLPYVDPPTGRHDILEN